MQVYYYNWGTEDVPSATITVTKLADLYTITFNQSATDIDCFMSLMIVHGTVIKRAVVHQPSVLPYRSEVVTVSVKNNPRPEALFEISD